MSAAKKKGAVAGPVVVVTGASQGIGAAIARAFATNIPRARLALVSRNAVALGRVALACRKETGVVAEVFSCDVTDEAAVEQLRRAVERRFRRVDVLVNNAGAFRPGSFLDMTSADFDAMIAANLRSVFLVSRAFVPGMVARRRGDVFNMSSIAGLQAYPGGAGYCAAKFGVTGLSGVMRAELREHGVRVCAVHPGATVSPSWDGSGIDPQRMMPAEDIARAIVDVFRLSRRTVVEEIVLRPQRGDV